jgi:hypothetical protein
MRSASKVLRKLGLIVAVLAAIALLASVPVLSSYESRAVLTQRVQVDDAAASLFGDGHRPVGSPQELVIDDPKAFVDGKGENGARLVSENYLQEKGIYPLQLRTVQFVGSLTRIGLAVALVVGLLLVALTRPRPQVTTTHSR